MLRTTLRFAPTAALLALTAGLALTTGTYSRWILRSPSAAAAAPYAAPFLLFAISTATSTALAMAAAMDAAERSPRPRRSV